MFITTLRKCLLVANVVFIWAILSQIYGQVSNRLYLETGHTNYVHDLRFSDDCSYLISTSHDRSLRKDVFKLWDWKTGVELFSTDDLKAISKLVGISSEPQRAGGDDLKVLESRFRAVEDGYLIAGSAKCSASGLVATSARNDTSLMPIHIFSADGYAKLAAFGKRVVFYNSDTEHRDGEIVDMFSSMSSDEGTIFFSRDARILRYVINRVEQFWDLSSGRMLAEDDPLLEAYGARIYETIIPAHKEESIWVAGRIGKIKAELASDSRLNIINAQNNRLLITLLRVGEREWITTTPDGRFDTNKTLDKIDGLHWVVNEEILKPVPLEAFMRQYYEPGLLQRVLKCNEKNNCDKEFKPLPAIARINRVQPQVAVPRTTP